MHKVLQLVTQTALIGALFISTANAADLTWGGFGSAFYGQALTSGLLPFGLTNTSKPNFTDYSLFGLNFNAKIDDHWSAGAQLVALGDKTAAVNTTNSTFNVQAAWAAVTYKTDAGTAVKAGRQRFPIFTASEFVYEHNELPYREIPTIVFQMASFVAFDGFSVSQSLDSGIGKFNVQAFGGTPVLAVIPPTSGTPQLSNLLGVRLNLEGDGWRVRAQASRSSSASVNAAGNLLASADSQYFSVGYRYDKNDIVSWGEFLYRAAPDGTVQNLANGQHQYLGNGKAGYVLVGYRFGNWLPRYTFAQAKADLGTVGEGQSTTHTIGVNYAFSPKVTFKGEYELTLVPLAGSGYKVTQPAGTDATSGSAIYAGLDFQM